MIRLPNLPWQEDSSVDINGILRDVGRFPIVLFETGIKDVWEDLESEDFFCGRECVAPIPVKTRRPIDNIHRPAVIYIEQDPRIQYKYMANLWLYLSPQGDWEVKKLVPLQKEL